MKSGRYFAVSGVFAMMAIALFLFLNAHKRMEHREVGPTSVGKPILSPSTSAPDEPAAEQLGATARIAQNKPKEEVVKEYFSKAIDFYGVAKDGKGNPIANADVEYSVYSDWLSPNPQTMHGPRSDDGGRFAITGKQGASILVRVMHPDYYETEQSKINISFAQPVGPLPTASKPFVFVLRKKGHTEPLVKDKQVLRNVPKNGQPVRVGLSGKNANDLTIRAWTSPRPAGAPNNAPFDWKVRMEVPGGGLVAYADAYQFEAPSEGYAPTIEFVMHAGGIDGKWRDRFEETFFVKLASGNYARMRFQMIAGGNHFSVVESYYNPKPGSRNLEYDPKQSAPTP